jgi:homoserine O-acetyltransferase
MPPADTVVAFETTRGTFHVTVHPRWSPLGAARFLKLVAEGFYDGCAVYRVIHGFIAQFGLPADPARNSGHVPFKDDPRAKISNSLGTVSFAAHGPNSRNTQIFINLMDNAQLDRSKFTPFAVVDSHGYNMQVGERAAEEGRGRGEGERGEGRGEGEGRGREGGSERKGKRREEREREREREREHAPTRTVSGGRRSFSIAPPGRT